MERCCCCCCREEEAIKLDGLSVAQMKELKSAIYAVTFSPDGTQVASGGFSGVIYLHDATSGEKLREFLPTPVDGQQVARATAAR